MNDWNHCIIENQKRYKLFNVEIITGILNARGSKYPTKNIVRSSAFVLSKSLKYFKNVDVLEYQGLTIMGMRRISIFICPSSTFKSRKVYNKLLPLWNSTQKLLEWGLNQPKDVFWTLPLQSNAV